LRFLKKRGLFSGETAEVLRYCAASLYNAENARVDKLHKKSKSSIYFLEEIKKTIREINEIEED